MAERGPDVAVSRRGGWRWLVPAGATAVVLVGIVASLASSGDDGSLRTTRAETTGDAAGSGSASRPDGAGPVTSGPGAPTSAVPSTAVPSTTGATGPGTTAATPPTTGGATPTTVSVLPAGAGARVQVKFADGTGVRLRDGRFVSLTGTDLGGLTAVLGRYPGTTIERLFTRSEEDLAAEKAAAEAATGRPQPDLNLYFRLTLRPGVDGATAIADLSRLPVVERAYADPVAAPPPAPAP